MHRSPLIIFMGLLLLAHYGRFTLADAPTTQPAPAVVSLTDVAAKVIRSVVAAQNMPRYGLRVGVKPTPNGKE